MPGRTDTQPRGPRPSPVLALLSADDRALVLAVARRRSFARRAPLSRHDLHIVEQGWVGLRPQDASPRALRSVLGAGDVLGELAFLGPDTTGATAVALEATRTLTLAAARLPELRERHAAVERLIAVALATSVRRLESDLAETRLRDPHDRLRSRLLSLWGIAGGEPLPFVHDELASLCGTSRTTVHRFLAQGVAEGWVELGRGRIRIRDGAFTDRAAHGAGHDDREEVRTAV